MSITNRLRTLEVQAASIATPPEADWNYDALDVAELRQLRDIVAKLEANPRRPDGSHDLTALSGDERAELERLESKAMPIER